MIEVGNLNYFIGIGFFLLMFLLVGLILKNKSHERRKRILLFLAFFNLAVHFLKLLIPMYYNDLPMSIKKITFENICAVSAIIFPFILLKNNNPRAKDYMFYMGIISGLASMFFPTEMFGKELRTLNTLRFYICHILIFIVPFYMVFFDIHTLEAKRLIYFPISFLIVLCVIYLNELILMEMGFVDMRGNDIVNYNYRNFSFIFGPIPELESISNFLFDWMVPKPFKQIMVGEFAGTPKYMPVLWLVVPCFVYLPVVGFLLYLVFTKIIKRGIK